LLHRQTFAERLDDVAAYARRTERLGELQRYLALILGGEAGARLAARIAVPVSADTLLRMAVATAPSREPIRTPRVLAVDDWAWRRGHRYGSILVDLERNQVIDLLPDRQAETVAEWLLRHPGVEVVARDRAGAYADGVSQGAPNAMQVADRWHLLRNLGDAIHAVVEKHYTALCRLRTELLAEVTADSPRETPTAITTAMERRKLEAYARRQARYEEAAQLKAVGLSISAISKQIGADRKTIVGWLRAGGAPLWRKPPRATMLDPYREHLDRRWREGCRNAARLWRELVTVGFAGNAKVVRAWAGRRRKSEPFGASAANRAVPPPSSRRVTRLLMANHDLPLDAEQDLITRVLARMPELAQCVAAAKRLSDLLRRKSQESLEGVLNYAAAIALRQFVAGLRRDGKAIQAALDLPWTTSPAEGQINRLKMLKRTMYGRASFDLLRARVLNCS
jgi:transposase